MPTREELIERLVAKALEKKGVESEDLDYRCCGHRDPASEETR